MNDSTLFLTDDDSRSVEPRPKLCFISIVTLTFECRKVPNPQEKLQIVERHVVVTKGANEQFARLVINTMGRGRFTSFAAQLTPDETTFKVLPPK